MPNQVPKFIDDFKHYKIMERTIASSVVGMAPSMVIKAEYNHSNKDSVLLEHHLRRSDPHVTVDFLAMTYGEAVARTALTDLRLVSLPALAWQMSRSMTKANMYRFYTVVILKMSGLKMSDGPVVPTSPPVAAPCIGMSCLWRRNVTNGCLSLRVSATSLIGCLLVMFNWVCC